MKVFLVVKQGFGTEISFQSWMVLTRSRVHPTPRLPDLEREREREKYIVAYIYSSAV